MTQLIAAGRRLWGLTKAGCLGVKPFFTRREEGNSVLEYALLLALLALACITAIQVLGGGLANFFNSVSNTVANVKV